MCWHTEFKIYYWSNVYQKDHRSGCLLKHLIAFFQYYGLKKHVTVNMQKWIVVFCTVWSPLSLTFSVLLFRVILLHTVITWYHVPLESEREREWWRCSCRGQQDSEYGSCGRVWGCCAEFNAEWWDFNKFIEIILICLITAKLSCALLLYQIISATLLRSVLIGLR